MTGAWFCISPPVSFINDCHVVGLTRRRQGLSDKPLSGYDTATLAEEVKAFLDVMEIEHVILIADSIGRAEVTRFAAL